MNKHYDRKKEIIWNLQQQKITFETNDGKINFIDG